MKTVCFDEKMYESIATHAKGRTVKTWVPSCYPTQEEYTVYMLKETYSINLCDV